MAIAGRWGPEDEPDGPTTDDTADPGDAWTEPSSDDVTDPGDNEAELGGLAC